MKDLIERREAIEEIKREWESCEEDYSVDEIIHYTRNAIDRVPSARCECRLENPGRWLRVNCGFVHMAKCSECGNLAMAYYRFCPHCGSYNIVE